MTELLIAAPLRVEALALRSRRARVIHTGMGPRRARAAAERLAREPGAALAVVGLCGALDPALGPGDLVVASELRDGDGAVLALPAAAPLVAALERQGLRVHSGPLVTVPKIVRGAERARLAAPVAGAEAPIAVDMESALLAPAAAGRPLAVVRAVVDTPARELTRPWQTASGGLRGLRALRAALPALEQWAAAVRPRELLLASPRASCAGVDRAVAIVEDALARRGAPLYVRRQIVHNAHVVAELEARGVVFVQELDEVPPGETVVFAAHGVSPAVRAQAAERELEVIDATCPLVNKVHAEARRFAAAGRTILLVGHADHEEVEGVVGEAPDSIHVIGDESELTALDLEPKGDMAFLTQTTLAVDETAELIGVLHERFPGIAGPRSDDICYATQNRQDAVKAIAARCDRVVVVGSANSSNAARLVEVSERSGCPARLIDDECQLDLDWLAGAATVGITAGASAPEPLVERVVATLAALGPTTVAEQVVAEETLRFRASAAPQPRR